MGRPGATDMTSPVALLFGVHAHQPAGNFPAVIDHAHERCYGPFLRTMADYPPFRFALAGFAAAIAGASVGRRLGERTRVLVDGPSDDHELVLRARLATQAPDIDSVVYLTDCDPSSLPAGTLVKAEIVGARDYDLLARPLP